jgi:hypothetical protein
MPLLTEVRKIESMSHFAPAAGYKTMARTSLCNATIKSLVVRRRWMCLSPKLQRIQSFVQVSMHCPCEIFTHSLEIP